MKKTIELNSSLVAKAVVAVVAIVGLVSSVMYEVGYNSAAKAGETKRLSQANTYAAQWSKDRLASDRLTSDYNTACYNYQTLYAAYDQLYKKAGAGTGLAYIPLPDGAKGNDNSCYRAPQP